MADVRYWHKADIPNLAVNIRFRKVKADIGQAAGCNIHQHVPVQTYRVGLREQILVLSVTGLGALGLLGWRRKRKANRTLAI